MDNETKTLSEKDRSREKIKNVVRAGMLAAVASILYYFPEIPMPFFAAWLKLDLSYVPVLIGSFAMGPIVGGAILVVKDIIGLIHSSTGGVGELADVIVGLSLMLPASIIYKVRKTRKRAMIGMTVGTILMAVMAVICNRFLFVPLLLGNSMGAEELARYLTFAVVPFNLIKAVVACGLTLVLYKSLRRAKIL